MFSYNIHFILTDWKERLSDESRAVEFDTFQGNVILTEAFDIGVNLSNLMRSTDVVLQCVV